MREVGPGKPAALKRHDPLDGASAEAVPEYRSRRFCSVAAFWLVLRPAWGVETAGHSQPLASDSTRWRADHHMHLASVDLCARVGECLPSNDPPWRSSAPMRSASSTRPGWAKASSCLADTSTVSRRSASSFGCRPLDSAGERVHGSRSRQVSGLARRLPLGEPVAALCD